jgi:hypothetical protein
MGQHYLHRPGLRKRAFGTKSLRQGIGSNGGRPFQGEGKIPSQCYSRRMTNRPTVAALRRHGVQRQKNGIFCAPSQCAIQDKFVLLASTTHREKSMFYAVMITLAILEHGRERVLKDC